MGPAAQRAVEGVGVRVGEAREDDAPQPVGPLRRRQPRPSTLSTTPAPSTVTSTSSATPSASQALLEVPGRGHAVTAGPARSASDCRQRLDAGEAVVEFGVLGGAVRDAGGVADEEHRGGHSGRGQDACVVAGRRGKQRGRSAVTDRIADDAGQVTRQLGVELDQRRERLGRRREGRAVTTGPLRGLRR